MRFSHACSVSLLLIVLPISACSFIGEQSGNREVINKKCFDDEVNRILRNSSIIPIQLQPVDSCFNHHFPELCDNSPVSNNHWILHTTGCSVTLYSITSELQQVITLERCHTIYKCWLVFDNTSICLFLSSEDNPQPAKRLYLEVLSVQQGKWTIPKDGHQSVFFHHVGTISSSVALREIIDDEKGKVAEFFIGNGRILWRLTLLLDYSTPEFKYPSVCKRDHRVVHVSKAGTDNMIVICDNQIILINLELRKSIDITPLELKNMSLYSAKSFISRSGKTALLTVESQGSTTNCFIFLDTISSSSRCKVLPGNNTVTDGVFINDIFFGLLNYTTITVMNTSYTTITLPYSATVTNVCAVSNCHLYQTEKLLYIYGQQNTIVLDKDAYKPVTVQNASIHTVLPIVEKAYRNCKMLLPISVVSPSSTASLSSDLDSQSFMPSTTPIDVSGITPSTTISTMKSSILATTYTTSTTVSMTAIPITRSPLLIQVVDTANFEESTTPTSSIVAEKPNLKTLRSIIIPVVTASLGGLLVVMVTIIYCCCRGVKDHFSLNTREKMMIKRNKCELPWHTPLISLPVVATSQRKR